MFARTLIGLCTLAATHTALAQPVQPAIVRDAMRPDVLRRDVAHFDRELDLDPAQVDIIQLLIADYVSAFHDDDVAAWFHETAPRPDAELEAMLDETRAQLRSNLRAAIAAHRAGDADENDVRTQIAAAKQVWRDAVPDVTPEQEQAEQDMRRDFSFELADRLDAFAAHKAELLERLFVDIDMVLTSEQSEQWPDVWRRFHRTAAIARGRLSGERIDVAALLRGLGIEGVEDEVDAYEAAIDTALLVRDRAVSRSRVGQLRAHTAGNAREQSRQRALQAAAHVDVRDMNDEHVELIAAALDSDDAERFRASYERRAYATVFRPTPAHRALALAMARCDTGEARAELEALQTELDAELAPVRAQLIDATRSTEVAEMRGDEIDDTLDLLLDRVDEISARFTHTIAS